MPVKVGNIKGQPVAPNHANSWSFFDRMFVWVVQKHPTLEGNIWFDITFGSVTKRFDIPAAYVKMVRDDPHSGANVSTYCESLTTEVQEQLLAMPQKVKCSFSTRDSDTVTVYIQNTIASLKRYLELAQATKFGQISIPAGSYASEALDTHPFKGAVEYIDNETFPDFIRRGWLYIPEKWSDSEIYLLGPSNFPYFCQRRYKMEFSKYCLDDLKTVINTDDFVSLSVPFEPGKDQLLSIQDSSTKPRAEGSKVKIRINMPNKTVVLNALPQTFALNEKYPLSMESMRKAILLAMYAERVAYNDDRHVAMRVSDTDFDKCISVEGDFIFVDVNVKLVAGYYEDENLIDITGLIDHGTPAGCFASKLVVHADSKDKLYVSSAKGEVLFLQSELATSNTVNISTNMLSTAYLGAYIRSFGDKPVNEVTYTALFDSLMAVYREFDVNQDSVNGPLTFTGAIMDVSADKTAALGVKANYGFGLLQKCLDKNLSDGVDPELVKVGRLYLLLAANPARFCVVRVTNIHESGGLAVPSFVYVYNPSDPSLEKKPVQLDPACISQLRKVKAGVFKKTEGGGAIFEPFGDEERPIYLEEDVK